MGRSRFLRKSVGDGSRLPLPSSCSLALIDSTVIWFSVDQAKARDDSFRKRTGSADMSSPLFLFRCSRLSSHFSLDSLTIDYRPTCRFNTHP